MLKKNVMLRTEKQSKEVPVEEPPDNDSLEGQEPPTSISKGGGITSVFVRINDAETN